MLVLDWVDVAYTGNAGSELGAAMVAADLDADGIVDMVVGAPGEDSVYVWLGSGAGLSGAPDVTLSGTSGTSFGAALGTGDLDGDGVLELVVGAPDADSGTGAVSVLTAPTSGSWSSRTLEGGAAGDTFGWVVAVDDLDGDGLDDVVVGAPDAAAGLGVAYVYTAASGWETPSWVGRGTYGSYGHGLTTGDFDADGYPDLVVGEYWELLNVYSGSASGPATSATTLASSRYFEACHTGDVDADGVDDLITSGDGGGGVIRWGDAAGLGAGTGYGHDGYEFSTSSASGVGDLDGDGFPEFADARDAREWFSGVTSNYGTLVWSGSRVDDERFYSWDTEGILLLPDQDGDGYGSIVLADIDGVLTVRAIVSDADGDDWSPDDPVAPDCDDADATVGPIAAEVSADGIDQDCDGVDPVDTWTGDCVVFVDWEAVEAWYVDRVWPNDPNAYVTELDAVGWAWSWAGWSGEDDDDLMARIHGEATDGAGGTAVTDYRQTTSGYSTPREAGWRSWSLPGGSASGVVGGVLAYTSAAGESWTGALTLASGEVATFTRYSRADSTEMDGDRWTRRTTSDWTFSSCAGSETEYTDYIYDEVMGTADDGFELVEWRTHWGCKEYVDVWIGYAGAGRVYDTDAGALTRVVPTVDEDGDGFGPDVDCDDHDAALHPCSGYTRHELWPDADGDGYGSAGEARESCAVTDGWVENSDDCDDTDPTLTLLEWPYTDDDGDGYGAEPWGVWQCGLPEGASVLDGDCDDADPTRNPGAEELCDEVDQDCDGSSTAGAVDEALLWFDFDEDGFGAGTPRPRCPAPDHAAVGGDCNDLDDDTYPGAPERLGDGVDQDCDGNDPLQPVDTTPSEPGQDPNPWPTCATTGPAAVGWLALVMTLGLVRGRRR